MEITVAIEGNVRGGVDGKGHRMGVVGTRDYGSDSLGLGSADQVLVDTQYLVAVVAAVAAVVVEVGCCRGVLVVGGGGGGRGDGAGGGCGDDGDGAERTPSGLWFAVRRTS